MTLEVTGFNPVLPPYPGQNAWRLPEPGIESPALLSTNIRESRRMPCGAVTYKGETSMSAEKRVAELGLDLSKVPTPIANYVPSVRTGNLVFLSGQGPTKPEGGMVTGKLGRDISIEEGYAAARLVAIGLLSALRAEIGSLDRVTRVVKLLGMVNGTTDFTDQPAVVNGASDLLVDIFGDRGKHARSAVGMGSLPMGISVEVELIVEVE